MAQTNISRKTGKPYKHGSERYYCVATRRREYKMIPQKKLLNLIKDPTAKQEYEVKRRCRVRGDVDYSGKASTSAQVVEKEGEFKEQFIEGHFYPIDNYLKICGAPDLKTLKAKVACGPLSPWEGVRCTMLHCRGWAFDDAAAGETYERVGARIDRG